MRNNLYFLVPETKFKVHSLKILEDYIYYSHIPSWNEFIDYLNDILIDEINFGIPKEKIERWHRTLQEYFSQEPSEKSVQKLFCDVGYTKEVGNEINRVVNIMKNDKKIILELKKFHMYFSEIFK